MNRLAHLQRANAALGPWARGSAGVMNRLAHLQRANAALVPGPGGVPTS